MDRGCVGEGRNGYLEQAILSWYRPLRWEHESQTTAGEGAQARYHPQRSVAPRHFREQHARVGRPLDREMKCCGETDGPRGFQQRPASDIPVDRTGAGAAAALAEEGFGLGRIVGRGGAGGSRDRCPASHPARDPPPSTVFVLDDLLLDLFPVHQELDADGGVEREHASGA